mgnify:CR=1 FL=1
MKFGILELLLIGGLFLIIFGPKRIGQVGSSFKKSVQEVRSTLSEGSDLTAENSNSEEE